MLHRLHRHFFGLRVTALAPGTCAVVERCNSHTKSAQSDVMLAVHLVPSLALRTLCIAKVYCLDHHPYRPHAPQHVPPTCTAKYMYCLHRALYRRCSTRTSCSGCLVSGACTHVLWTLGASTQPSGPTPSFPCHPSSRCTLHFGHTFDLDCRFIPIDVYGTAERCLETVAVQTK